MEVPEPEVGACRRRAHGTSRTPPFAGNDTMGKNTALIGSYFFAELGDKVKVPEPYLTYGEDTFAAGNNALRKKTVQLKAEELDRYAAQAYRCPRQGVAIPLQAA